MSTQWTAQWAVAAELARADYEVAFTGGNTPMADLMVRHRDGRLFSVDVKGSRPTNAKGTRGNSFWAAPKPLDPNLFYVVVLVGRDRAQDQFFITSQAEWHGLIADYGARHSGQENPGFDWADILPFKDRWDKLPG
jgi:hypothetical protein